MRIADMTWMQVEEYLLDDDRCVLPLGSTEQHAYLSLAVDAILAEKVAGDAAGPEGVPVFPVLAYGLTPYFMAYPGTVTISPDTYASLLGDILDSLHAHGFRKILIVNGHGGNAQARPAAESWSDAHPGTSLRWHDWWKAPRTMAAVREIDEDASHASWMEGFPWTRVETARPPEGHKPAVDLSGREDMTPARFRERLGDGSFGGFYERPDEDLHRIWAIAVEETRALLSGGW
ncbi:MAG: creatininase family protein [Gemmatimonadota bacterium]|nr:creatininase family protein [Gemmatimonadota bacterium]